MSMNMSGMSAMSMATATATMSAPQASSTAGMSMGGMSMGGGSTCKISMLWNWYTVDSCFLSRSWHNTSKGMFAGSCIGTILLVILLEFLRRSGKEYDRYLVAQHLRSLSLSSPSSASSTSSAVNGKGGATTTSAPACNPGGAAAAQRPFRPNVLQQAIRALLHMFQFAVAYFVMLLAMYYNGYIIICIFIGAYLGFFIFGWENFNVKQGGSDRMQEEVTVCCG